MRRKYEQVITGENRSNYYRKYPTDHGIPVIRSLIPEMVKATGIARYEISVHAGIPYQTLHRAAKSPFPARLDNATASTLIWFFSEYFQRAVSVDDLFALVDPAQIDAHNAHEPLPPVLKVMRASADWEAHPELRGKLALRSQLPALITESGLSRLEVAMRAGLPYQTVSRFNKTVYPVRTETGTISALCAFFSELFHRDVLVGDLLALEQKGESS